jgi:hypothetical protein
MDYPQSGKANLSRERELYWLSGSVSQKLTEQGRPFEVPAATKMAERRARSRVRD